MGEAGGCYQCSELQNRRVECPGPATSPGPATQPPSSGQMCSIITAGEKTAVALGMQGSECYICSRLWPDLPPGLGGAPTVRGPGVHCKDCTEHRPPVPGPQQSHSRKGDTVHALCSALGVQCCSSPGCNWSAVTATSNSAVVGGTSSQQLQQAGTAATATTALLAGAALLGLAALLVCLTAAWVLYHRKQSQVRITHFPPLLLTKCGWAICVSFILQWH